MALFRDSRFKEQKLGETTPFVGPGSYELGSSFSKSSNSCAPFNSSSFRAPISQKEDIPGPGAYVSDVGPMIAQTKISTSIDSRAPRFSKNANDIPGPGTYYKYEEPPPVGVRATAQSSLSDSAKSIQWEKRISAPSIPNRFQSYGYEEDHHSHQLTIQKPPDHDTSLGPAYYNTATNLGTSSHAASFAHSKTKRDTFIPKTAVPGPGSYELRETGKFKLPLDDKRRSSAFASSKPRFEAHTSSGPGPGAYDLSPKSAPKIHPKFVSAFNTSVGRGTKGDPLNYFERSNGVPGPGAYDEIRDGLGHNLFSPVRYTRSVFGSTAPRFTKAMNIDTPGPGAYSPAVRPATSPSPQYNSSFRQKNLSLTAPFGSTARRFEERERERERERTSLDPAAQLEGLGSPPSRSARKTPVKPAPGPSAVFRSTTARVVETQSMSPGPGQYRPEAAFHVTADKKDHSLRGSSVFASKSARSPTSAIDTPGPGAYSPPSPLAASLKRNILTSRAPRFKDKLLDNSPGPGDYAVSNSLNKRTFNITILAEEQKATVL